MTEYEELRQEIDKLTAKVNQHENDLDHLTNLLVQTNKLIAKMQYNAELMAARLP